MMHKPYTLFAFFFLLITGSLSAQHSFKVVVENPSTMSRGATLVVVPQTQLRSVASDFNEQNFSVWQNRTEVPSQFVKHGSEGLSFVVEKLEPRERIEFTVRYEKTGVHDHHYPKRTQAELSHKTGGQFVNREYTGGAFQNVRYLRVPPEHKDHSWFIRYEGPGWESDKVGYRFYLDQRNATDVFGKLTNNMVLQQVGQDGFDSYHELQPWGMDVMKVGKSLGLGSIGFWNGTSASRVEFTDSVTCGILENGDLYSAIETRYLGWRIGQDKIDVQSLISIHGGTRLTSQQLTLSKDVQDLCTGIVKDKSASLIVDKGSKSKYGYLATWGKQSLNGDELGLAVFFSPNDYVGITEDEFSHIVKLKSNQRKLQYYFLAAWVKEPGGITTEAAFREHLDAVATSLATPVKISVQKK